MAAVAAGTELCRIVADAHALLGAERPGLNFPQMLSAVATVLVVSVVADKLFPPEEASKLIADAVPGARLFLYGLPLGHQGCAVHLGKANEAIVKVIAQAQKN